MTDIHFCAVLMEKQVRKGGYKMWVTRFVRKDGQPDEEYYYYTEKEAEDHRGLFDDDDSGLYERIEVEEVDI